MRHPPVDIADVPALPIRRLGAADLPACLELTMDRDWPPEEHKWRLLFRMSEVYAAGDPAGGLAGVVVLTRYGPDLAAIGMMVVASRYGRRGLGRRLLRHALDQAEGAVAYLTATEYGRPLYEKIGFRGIDTSVQHTGQFRPEPAGGGPRSSPRPVTETDLAPVAAVDRTVFGADRGRMLTELCGFAEQFLVVADPAITGYAAAWRNGDVLSIGTVVADDISTATALISSLVAAESGQVRLDILGRHPDLSAWAIARGLPARDRTALMVYDGQLPGDRARLYAPVSVATG